MNANVFKRYDAKTLLVGGGALLFCMVAVAMVTYFLYRMVGPGLALVLTIASLIFQIFFWVQCRRSPAVRKNHLILLHKWVWSRWTGKVYAALVLTTIASMIGLLMTGWLFTWVLTLVLVLWIFRDIRAAEILL